METVQIIYSKYEPWDKLITFDGYWEAYSIEGSELARLKPNELLRVVPADAGWERIGQFLHGWWMEHYIASLEGHVNAMPEANELRTDAFNGWLSWIGGIDLSTVADELEWLLHDDINDLLPDTHEWGIHDGWYAVAPKGMNV
jgi:hypothetical protein